MTTEPIRSADDAAAMMDYFKTRGEYRNYSFVGVGLYSALRVGDIVKLKWKDVYDFQLDRFKERLQLTEQKTKKRKTVFLNDQLIDILKEDKEMLEAEGTVGAEDFLFKSRKGENRPITRQQAYRLVRDAAKVVGIGGVIGCHSLRKSFGYAAHMGGASPAVIMDIYNHSSYKITKQYLGIEQEERDLVYREVSFKKTGIDSSTFEDALTSSVY